MDKILRISLLLFCAIGISPWRLYITRVRTGTPVEHCAGFGCGDKGDGDNGDGDGGASAEETTEDPGSGLTDATPSTPPTEEPLPLDASGAQKLLGPDVAIYAWDEDRYIAEGGTVPADNMLDCDLESECCWRNAHGPEDAVQWTQTAGEPDQAKFRRNFFTEKMPEKQFAVAYSPGTEDHAKEARFFSCTIPQTNEPVKVTFRHWTSDDVQLRVCTRDAFYPEPEPHLLNCKPVPRGNGPGPSTVFLPPGDNFDIVIVASNFLHDGNIAIIDDIKVDYVLTDTGDDMDADLPFDFPTTAPPIPEECNTVPCDFNAPEGEIRLYAVAYVTQEEKAALVTEIPGGLFEERAFKFMYYDSVDGLVLRGCCNGWDDCPFSSDDMTNPDSRQWMEGVFTCPAGTDILVFLCDNQNGNQGACGIDDIQVVYADTLEPACPQVDYGEAEFIYS